MRLSGREQRPNHLLCCLDQIHEPRILCPDASFLEAHGGPSRITHRTTKERSRHFHLINISNRVRPATYGRENGLQRRAMSYHTRAKSPTSLEKTTWSTSNAKADRHLKVNAKYSAGMVELLKRGREQSRPRHADSAVANEGDSEPVWMVRCRCGCHHDNTTNLECEQCTKPMIACDECDVWLHLECLGFPSGCSKAPRCVGFPC